MSHDETDDAQASPRTESFLKGEKKRVSEPLSESQALAEKEPGTESQDFPEGGWAGWATAIGACVPMGLFRMRWP